MIRKTITLTPKLAKAIDEISEDTGFTVSDLIRRAIEMMLKEYKKGKE